jgi:stage III sporulation protein AH
MRVMAFGKMRRLTAVLASLAIVAALAAGVYGYGREYRSVKVDRSTAMQVVRPLNESVSPPITDFFTEYRLERERVRSERSDVLRDILRAAKTDETRGKAQEAMLRLVLEKQRETEMENLIKARGFSDALVFVRDSSVSAVVRAPSLTREEVVQVADVISRVAGVRAEDITISAKP